MDYLLDTNIVSSIMDEDAAVMRRLDRLGVSDNVYSSVITEGELRFGARKVPMPRADRIRRQVDKALSLLAGVIPVTRAAAQVYSEVRYEITAGGTPLPDNDVWIAAVALANDYVLVSHDSGFARIPDVKLEDWLEP